MQKLLLYNILFFLLFFIKQQYTQTLLQTMQNNLKTIDLNPNSNSTGNYKSENFKLNQTPKIPQNNKKFQRFLQQHPICNEFCEICNNENQCSQCKYSLIGPNCLCPQENHIFNQQTKLCEKCEDPQNCQNKIKEKKNKKKSYSFNQFLEDTFILLIFALIVILAFLIFAVIKKYQQYKLQNLKIKPMPSIPPKKQKISSKQLQQSQSQSQLPPLNNKNSTSSILKISKNSVSMSHNSKFVTSPTLSSKKDNNNIDNNYHVYLSFSQRKSKKQLNTSNPNVNNSNYLTDDTQNSQNYPAPKTKKKVTFA